MKKIAWGLVLLTFLAAVFYSTLSLYRWEWTRALYFGMVALLAEVAIAAGVVLRRLTRVTERRVAEREELMRLLAQTREYPDRFAWLRPEQIASRTNVFITMLVGGGVLLSGVAWIIDRVAGNTAGNMADQALASDLSSIAYPAGGLLVDEVAALAQSMPHLEDPHLRLLLGSGEP